MDDGGSGWLHETAVAEGVEFSDGSVVVRWPRSLEVVAHIDDVTMRGNYGGRRILWTDDEDTG